MLDYAMQQDGSVNYTKDDVLVATVRPFSAHMPRPGFWVNMELEGMPWSAMPCQSLEAAGYLILASYLEMQAGKAS